MECLRGLIVWPFGGLWKRLGRQERGASSVAALLVVVAGYAAVVLSGTHVLQASIAPRIGLRALAADVSETAAYWGIDSGFVCYDEVYHEWSLAQVVNVTVEDRELRTYGPWPAHDDFYATEAASDGSITQWSDGYYITHNWSKYGKQILELVPGDTVTVGGTTMQVEGLFDYPDDGVLGQIRSIVGEEAIVLQTCEVDSGDLRRIVYGPRV